VFEFRRDRLVGSVCSLPEVPCPAVVFGRLGFEGSGERPVGSAALRRAGRVVDGRPDERVAERHRGAVDVDQLVESVQLRRGRKRPLQDVATPGAVGRGQ
jgi:hypothetical protein